MLRTLGIRITTAIISLLIVVVAGQSLGAEILGSISLLVVAVTIINLVGGFAGGAALVYLMPRNSEKSLLPISQIWAIVSGIFTAAVLLALGAFPADLALHVFLLGIIGSINQNFMAALLANQRIKAHNLISLLQSLIMIGVLLLMVSVFKEISIMSYMVGLYASYIVVLMLCIGIIPLQSGHNKSTAKNNLRILFGYGSLVQLSSLLALLTYRLTYYYTEAWLGLAALGILSVAVQISEAVWIFPKSIALVQFSKIANLKSDSDSANLTFFLAFITSIFTAVGLAILFFLPDEVYVFVFGSDFDHLSPVIRFIVPGIFAISLNIILSHFFSGTGRILINLVASASGLIAVAVSGYLLIHNGSVADAAWVSSLGYAATVLFSFLAFVVVCRKQKLSIRAGLKVFISK